MKKALKTVGLLVLQCFFFCVCPAKLDYTCRCKSGHGNRQWVIGVRPPYDFLKEKGSEIKES